MKYLVDANVPGAPTKPAPDPLVVASVRVHERDIAVDPVLLGELRFGILILPAGRKRTAPGHWFHAGDRHGSWPCRRHAKPPRFQECRRPDCGPLCRLVRRVPGKVAGFVRTETLYNEAVPVETTYSKLRENLSVILARSDADNEIFVVRRRKGRDIALIPADELSSILETAHLLSSPANARRLQSALKRADARETRPSTLSELRQDVGLESEP